MSAQPTPLLFTSVFKPKPWGGRRLAELYGKELPPGEMIGESWELADLPQGQTRVRPGPAYGPLAERTLGEIIALWGARLTGAAPLAEGRFPLLIKFLDARQPVSIQVHPRPPGPAVKHEAWYVVDADPGAELFLGLKPGVGPEDVAPAAGTAKIVELLQRRPVKAGDCFYLPSGVAHALGAGIVVAEIQTPSDITYRLYDWGRSASDPNRARQGAASARLLHIPEALANIRYDVADREIVQPRRHVADVFVTTTRLVTCAAFTIDKLRISAGVARPLPEGELTIWIVLTGRGRLVQGAYEGELAAGDVALIPAEHEPGRVEAGENLSVLEVTGGRSSREKGTWKGR
jgi:mannose-6-phosphate isomerase